MKLAPLCLAVCLLTAGAEAAPPPSRIFFGSCAHQDKPQGIWEVISAQRPDLFLLLGDNIYGDSTDPEVLREKYAQLRNVPAFRALRAAAPLLATWDDHDYGVNDGGADFPSRRASQQEFLNFLEEPASSPRRSQDGIYHAQTFGEKGPRLQVILLDTRYFRSPLKREAPERIDGKLSRRIQPQSAPDATILGAAQWRWLEERLQEPAEVRLICSSIQVVPEEHRFEKWANFPRERDRLLRLLRRSGVRTVLLSGDRHLAEISRLAEPAGSAPLWEITSSGLTHAGGGKDDEPNRHRVGPAPFRQQNFGSVEIDWSATPRPEIHLRIWNAQGEVAQDQPIK